MEMGTESFFMMDSCPRGPAAFLCLMVAGLGGCATGPDIAQLEAAHLRPPIRILVMESPISVDSDRLQAVLAPDAKTGTPPSAALLAEGKARAQAHALASMESALDKQPGLKTVALPANGYQHFNQIAAENFQRPITPSDANWLHEATGADELMRFHITDYGLTPKSWHNAYIAFEVTSTLAIAGVIAYSGAAAAKTAAGAYLVQETAEETAEAYAGFWGLDVVSRPVKIDAELIRLNPLATLWKTSDTGLSATRLSRLTRKVSPEERNRQLDQSTDEAVTKVATELQAGLEKSFH